MSEQNVPTMPTDDQIQEYLIAYENAFVDAMPPGERGSNRIEIGARKRAARAAGSNASPVVAELIKWATVRVARRT